MTTKRYWVIMRSGRKFMVEEWGDPHIAWGNIDPATKRLEKVSARSGDEINAGNSRITRENNFKNICFLSPGTSALGYIDALDSSGLERIESRFITYLDE